ncbi:MFS transporter [Cellvibrio sp. pealriver]|uniref:MFS transporter n=1 Tax=Cellvibrio sp. pealriver TaxID=1622269 RepID=UPI00066FE613|nr:MFS transporter [Cellvibrio sp. pealriver]
MQQNLSLNANRFVIFSVFFTARAYYPVLAVLFIDLGLTLDQFVLLNLIWALTIFLFEVPSGALADTIGRRTLLIAASVLMIVEMLCLLMAPRDGGTLLFVLCVINRICSGLSEACASGADEALAYDSLPPENRASAWDKLLASAMRWRSLGFVVAMIIGGLLYDPDSVNVLLPESLHVSENIAQRLPVLLVLLQAVACLLITLRMVEPVHSASGSTLTQAFRLTLDTVRWVITHPVALVVILVGVALDSIVRNFATITSSYYRLIELPEWTFGLLGAAVGVLGWFVPTMANYLNTRFSLMTNLVIISAATLLGLVLLVPMWPVYGLIPTLFLMMLMGYLGFTLSRTLHNAADSSRRATVLSVKGLVFNLGYGLFSLGFSVLLASFPDTPEGASLRNALLWQLPFFAVVISALLAWAFFTLRASTKP